MKLLKKKTNQLFDKKSFNPSTRAKKMSINQDIILLVQKLIDFQFFYMLY